MRYPPMAIMSVSFPHIQLNLASFTSTRWEKPIAQFKRDLSTFMPCCVLSFCEYCIHFSYIHSQCLSFTTASSFMQIAPHITEEPQTPAGRQQPGGEPALPSSAVLYIVRCVRANKCLSYMWQATRAPGEKP